MTKEILKWTVIGILIGSLVGFFSYVFFVSVNWATDFRRANDWIIYFLPLIGSCIVYLYHKYGKEIEEGNNLILDEIHDPKKIIPLRIAPFIFFTAVISHLFGASVGREGTAVQIGAGISDQFSKIFNNRRYLIMMGMSAGFASIFGAPIAGTIFGLEVLTLGMMRLDAIFPCTVAALAGFLMAKFLGLPHSFFELGELPGIYLGGIISSAIAGVFFGLVARLFVYSVHLSKDFFKRKVTKFYLRPFMAGLVLVVIFIVTRDDRYLGLGDDIIKESFILRMYPWDFVTKIFTTSISVGGGFKGGEVMPLFYIGSTLGNSLSMILPMSFSILAALGFVSVFGAALNVPLTAIVLGLEFFGPEIGIYILISCVGSYLVSGNESIYSKQRKALPKKI